MASAGAERLTGIEFRKKKELDEARRNGTLPPEQDTEGNLINPHNPDYISKRPWYLGDSGPSLKHQTLQNQLHLLSAQEADQIYLHGRKESQTQQQEKSVRTKWKKGSCKNCGAPSHKTQECVERPRKVGAWKTNTDIKDDRMLLDVRSQKFGKLAFDAKRDQWLGYDPREHAKTVERYGKVDAARKQLRMEKVRNQMEETAEKKQKRAADRQAAKTIPHPKSDQENSDSDSDYDSAVESEEEEFLDREEGPLFAERVARQGGVGGAQMMTTVRNLRIREDTAKYLRNLNPDSAYYDPKTRSMRDNPHPDLGIDESAFIGDNMIRCTGDAQKLASTQVFAWEAHARGTDIHPIANPSQTEFLKKQFEEKKKTLEHERRQKILERYGGENHLKVPPKELLMAQSDHYVEYSRDGRVVNGQERARIKSKYVEDVYENNHTSVWGSWFDRVEFQWGYSCCHSKVRNSYCTGQEGKQALESSRQLYESVENVHDDDGDTDALKSEKMTKRSDLYGETIAPDLDQKKLLKAIKRARKEQTSSIRKRNYNSMESSYVTAEDMEAYKLLKSREEDPMAEFLGRKNVLLDA
ncbi:hypothetical protein ABG067_004987 [Albugo candida]